MTKESSEPKQAIATIRECLSLEMEGKIMPTIAQYLEAIGEERGLERGIEEGSTEARKAVALKLMASGMFLKQIAEVTELPISVLEILYKSRSH